MDMIIYVAVISAILLFNEYRLTYHNMRKSGNGYGSLVFVLNGNAHQPAQYRVFVPWIWSLFKTIKWYIFLKYIGLYFSLYSCGFYFVSIGVNEYTGILMVAVLLTTTFIFDYVDCYYDLGFLALSTALILNGIYWLVVPIALFATLNRETGIFIPIIYYVLTGNIYGFLFIGMFSALGLVLPRILYGKSRRYCSINQWERNKKDFFIDRFGPFHAVFIGLMAWFFITGIWYILSMNCTDTIARMFYVMCVFNIIMMGPAVWCETRVFIPIYLAAVPMTLMLM